jgi:hypothetical protein
MELIISPRKEKKYRIIFKNKEKVDFGAKGYSDYTIHKDPFRMRNYINRHGGNINTKTLTEKNGRTLQRDMLDVVESDKENWSIDGMYTAGFWSRWLLWSHSDLSKAKSEITKRFKLRFVNK